MSPPYWEGSPQPRRSRALASNEGDPGAVGTSLARELELAPRLATQIDLISQSARIMIRHDHQLILDVHINQLVDNGKDHRSPLGGVKCAQVDNQCALSHE